MELILSRIWVWRKHWRLCNLSQNLLKRISSVRRSNTIIFLWHTMLKSLLIKLDTTNSVSILIFINNLSVVTHPSKTRPKIWFKKLTNLRLTTKTSIIALLQLTKMPLWSWMTINVSKTPFWTWDSSSKPCMRSTKSWLWPTKNEVSSFQQMKKSFSQLRSRERSSCFRWIRFRSKMRVMKWIRSSIDSRSNSSKHLESLTGWKKSHRYSGVNRFIAHWHRALQKESSM